MALPPWLKVLIVPAGGPRTKPAALNVGLGAASGALLTRYPEGLASALAKIGKYGQPLAHQSSAIAHLYIADPTGGRKIPWMSKLFMTPRMYRALGYNNALSDLQAKLQAIQEKV